MPIGGLKEKSLAARRVGIKTVIIPDGNARDVDELPAVVKEEITFIPVKQVDEVFAVVLADETKKTTLSEEKKVGKKSTKNKTNPLPSMPSAQQDSVRCKTL